MTQGGRTFLGYREPVSQKNARRGFNAGVWVVYNGPAAKRLFDGWWARKRAATWRPVGEASTCPGSEQWEFEVLLGLTGTGASGPRDAPSRELDLPTCVAKRLFRVGVALHGDGSFCDQGRPRSAAAVRRSPSRSGRGWALRFESRRVRTAACALPSGVR